MIDCCHKLQDIFLAYGFSLPLIADQVCSFLVLILNQNYFTITGCYRTNMHDMYVRKLVYVGDGYSYRYETT